MKEHQNRSTTTTTTTTTTTMAIVVLVVMLVAVSLVGVGCGDDQACSPFDTQVCSCDAAAGSRVCNADGTGWSECSCGGADADADADGDEDGRPEDGREGEGEGEGDGSPGDAEIEEDIPPPPPCNEITFRYVDATATSAWVSGTFNSWAPTVADGALEMTRTAGSPWEVTTLIEPTGRHEYKFIVDGTRWIPDPTNPEQVDDTYGGFNSVLWVCEEECDTTVFDWRDTVLYFAMTDRFYDSDGRSDPVPGASDGDARTGSSMQYEGGDLAGVTEKLPYLADLGVTALWLAAPYENRNTAGATADEADPHMNSAFHGYWPSPANISYADPANPVPRPQVESRIGTEADLLDLVSTAHATDSANGQGIKVLFDYVMKHADIESGLYAAHYDWFVRDGADVMLCGCCLWDDPYWGTRCAFADYLPPLDLYNPTVRAWSISDAVWWARTFNLDGFRLDAIKHVPFEWLRELRARLTTEFPDPAGGRFYLVGETYKWDERDTLRSFVDPETMLDGQFDFPLKPRVCEAVFTPGGGMNNLASFMDGNDYYYGANAIMSTFIGNHDIPRAIHFASRQIGDCRQGSGTGNAWTSDYPQPTAAEPYERLGVAFAVLLTNPGLPMIYYGDEIGLAGGGDPDNRRMMPWDDASLNPNQLALRDRVAALANARGTHPALGRGRRETLSVDQDTWVYRKTGCGAANDVIVAINRGDSAHAVPIPTGSYTDLITGGAVAGGSVSLNPRSFLVLAAE